MNGSSLFQIATRQYDHFYAQFIFQSAIMIQLAKYLTSSAKTQEKNVELLAVGVKVRRLLITCPSTGPKIVCAGPNVLCQTKNRFTYCAGSKRFMLDQKMICS